MKSGQQCDKPMMRWRRTPTRDRSSDETVICLQVEIAVPTEMREVLQAEADQQGVSLESVVVDILWRDDVSTFAKLVSSMVPDETEN